MFGRLWRRRHEYVNVVEQAPYEAHFTPAWLEYPERVHLMALAGEISQ